MEILSNLGNTLTKLKDYQNAWLAFDDALRISPANAAVVENYMLCLLEGKQFDKFEEMLAKYKYLSKDTKERLQALADEYRTTLGIKSKRPPPTLSKRASFLMKVGIASPKRNSLVPTTPMLKKAGTMAEFTPMDHRRSMMPRQQILQPVEEVKEPNKA